MPTDPEPIVGVWEVQAPEAPFPMHMMTFTPYGTMSQSNPHEGNKDESDSSGQGVWQGERLPGGQYKVVGKFVEFKADRATGQLIGKGVIRFSMVVRGDTFTGDSAAYRYDVSGERVAGPLASPITAARVVLADDEILKG